MHYVYFALIILGELVLIVGIMVVWGRKSKYPRLVLIVLCLCAILLTVLLSRFTNL